MNCGQPVRFNTTARPAKKINATFIRACSFLMCNRLSQITAERFKKIKLMTNSHYFCVAGSESGLILELNLFFQLRKILNNILWKRDDLLIAKNLQNNTRVIQKNFAKIFVNLNRVFLHETSPPSPQHLTGVAKLKGLREKLCQTEVYSEAQLTEMRKCLDFREATIFLKL